jgi:adenine-specific DNA-methyltransferase
VKVSATHQPRRNAAGASAQRLRGAYYTPGPLAAAIAAWAVTPTANRVLDPSCGNGILLAAARDRMEELRTPDIASRLYGVEIDTDACRHTQAALALSADQIRQADFFACSLADIGGQPFDAVIGNPPYVRHHLQTADAKLRAAAQARAAGIELNDRADAWAYFCAHALSFLAGRGRLALILPGSVLHADYALPLIHAFGVGSGHSELIRVGERVFPGVLERTILLLIDRSREGAGEVAYREVDDVTGLQRALSASTSAGRRKGRRPAEPAASADVNTRAKMRVAWHLTPAEASAWERVTALDGVSCLGDVARLRIGVVTGANAFFVRTSDELDRLGVDSVPLVARSGWFTGLRWTEQDSARPNRRSALMLIDPGAELSDALTAEIAAAEADKIDQRYHCSKRERWYVLADRDPPDLFLPYMSSTAPAAVINEAEATCTNAIHRVTLHPGIDPEAVAVASWTSLARLSAELFGRSYGGGVLKLELGEAARVQIALLDDARHAIAEVSTVLADGGRKYSGPAARASADQTVLVDGCGASPRDVRRLSQAADRLERKRTTG